MMRLPQIFGVASGMDWVVLRDGDGIVGVIVLFFWYCDMKKLLLRVAIMWLAVGGAAYLIPGIDVDTWWRAIIGGVLIALLNATVGAVLRLFALPMTFVTRWLMWSVITVVMVLLAWFLLEGFRVSSWGSAALFVLVTWVVSGVLQRVLRVKR